MREWGHDVWETGHKLDFVMGWQWEWLLAREFKKTKDMVIPIIGRWCFQQAEWLLEALNILDMKKTDMIVILNDNEMSIAHQTLCAFK